MFIATHVTMGVLIGQNIATPGLAIPLSMASHFLLDMVPHGDSQLYRNYKAKESPLRSIAYVATDAAFSIVLFIYLLEIAPYASRGMIVLSVAFSVLPDLLVALAEAVPGRVSDWVQRTHMRIHDSVASRTREIGFVHGLVMQLFVLFGLITLVI